MADNKVIWILIIVAVALFLIYVFGGFGNEPLFSPFEATIQLANTPPNIVSFLSIRENPDDVNGVTPDGEIQGDAGGTEGTGTVEVRLRFLVEDPDGPDDIPGLTGPAISEGTNLIVTYTEPLNDGTAGTNTLSAVAGDCSALSCVSNPACTDQSAGTNQKMYLCDIPMNYFDPPSPNGGAAAPDRWTISVTIEDASTNTDTAQSGDTGFTALANNYIYYRVIQGVSTGDVLAWSALNINLDDENADTGLGLDNVGNIQVVDEGVTGFNPCESGPNCGVNFIESAAFSVGDTVGGADTGACDAPGGGGLGTGGFSLADGVPATNVPVAISFSGDGLDTNTMYFCVWDQLSNGHIQGTPVSTYVANAANGNIWSVIFNSGIIP
jgi:hypothetical protein